jgi:hypothetical protein
LLPLQVKEVLLTLISEPADAVSVLAIGAVNSIGNRASFSSTGPSYDQRVKPDLMAQGYLQFYPMNLVR